MTLKPHLDEGDRKYITGSVWTVDKKNRSWHVLINRCYKNTHKHIYNAKGRSRGLRIDKAAVKVICRRFWITLMPCLLINTSDARG